MCASQGRTVQELALPELTVVCERKERPFCIHELFERQAQRTPDAIALGGGETRMSYRELNQQANQLARHLKTCGIGPEVPVALYLERTPLMVVAILAVLKAGGAYVPIDLAYPAERAEFMLHDAKAPVLLTQEKFRDTLPAGPRLICLDADQAKFAPYPTTDPGYWVVPENAAYIIYTSGSTGKPKGVVVTHHNVVRLLAQTAAWYGFNEKDVWVLFHSYAFDVSVWELWGALFHGGRLVVVSYLVTRSPAEFYQLLAREQVTVLNQTPSAFRQLIWAETTAPARLPLALRYVICAGEALELQSLRPWFAVHGDELPRVVNMYGITETTVHSTYRVIRQADLDRGVGSVIGVPIPDLQIYLVDEDLQPVPKGAPGEICVGGAGVARGYLNRPDLNERRFLTDPFSREPNARLYRSGDLAQYSPTGELEYLGRMDHQVKIRGFRVELGEIESALNRHPALRESVVLALDSEAGDKRLVAYCVPTGAAPTVTELREYLSRKVPDYMVPALFVMLAALPLTTNGKVDRRALPAPDRARPDLQAKFVAPRSPAEQALALIWGEVLGLEQVGIHDNFFELGGDSIRCITILARAQQRGMGLSLEQLFAHPTVAGLAAAAGTAGLTSLPAATTPFSLVSAADRALLPADVEDAYPVARLQLGMFYRNELNPASAIYHDVFSFRIQAAFEPVQLGRAVNGLLARHPVLRSSFHLAGFSEPMQLVHRSVSQAVTVEDLRQAPETVRAQRLADWVEQEKRRPFDRAVAPLVRFHAQWYEARCFQFIISFHHACLDGWSLAAVMTEILQEYTNLLQGRPPGLAPVQASYRDFVALERQTQAAAESQRFWTEKIREAQPALLPRWPQRYCAGGLEQQRGPELTIEPELLQHLRELAQSLGVPLKTVLLAAHLRVMGALYGQTDVISGLIANGRPEAVDGERLVGLFLNALPVRLALEGGTWLDLVQLTFAAERELLPHRRFPLAEIQKLNGGQPLFETAFDFVHFHVYKDLAGCPELDFQEGHYFEANDMTTYTTFMLDVTSSQLQLHLDYDPNVLAREQVEQITAFYLRTLGAMAADPCGRYEAFSPLDEATRRKLLVDWNASAQDYPRERCLHELFRDRVLATPNATALVCGAERLTYSELDAKAERLARRLEELGIGPEARVAICVERSVGMLVGLLGILKAGGAYVPLDPAFPRERLAFMLADCQPAALLTQPELLPLLPLTHAPVVCLQAQIGELAAEAPAPAQPAAGTVGRERPTAANRAYLIYTSGSTGTPKGVEVLHRGVVNLLLSAAKTAGVSDRDRVLAVTTLSFDIAALELFLPLITGGRLILASRTEAADGTQLAALIETSGATLLQATPATWRLLLDAGWPGQRRLKAFCGGEPLPRALADELLRRTGEVWNFYGPTETTIWSTAWKVEPDPSISIGRPLANTEVYILDSRLQPVPVGTAGELHIGGEGVARGYWQRPELTAARFIPDPFNLGPGRRLYKTGDLARYRPDGQLECLGRLDQQVKIRGFRIEPGEVEYVLRQHAGIADAVVAARADLGGESRLVGYLVSRNGPPALVELRDFVKSRLPAYMVPQHFVLLPSLPRTPNGKVDLRRLPAPDGATALPRDYRAPSTPAEQRLAAIWQEVLRVPDVGLADNFFDLGGDSLTATRTFARINQQFGSNLTLREMLEHPTVGALAGLVEHRRGLAPVSPIPRLPRPGRRPTS